MTRMSNHALATELEAAHIENQRLTMLVASLQNDVAALREVLAAAPSRDALAAAQKRIDELKAAARTNVRPAHVHVRDEAAERAHTAYVQALLRAREEAVRTGRSVLVG